MDDFNEKTEPSAKLSRPEYATLLNLFASFNGVATSGIAVANHIATLDGDDRKLALRVLARDIRATGDECHAAARTIEQMIDV